MTAADLSPESVIAPDALAGLLQKPALARIFAAIDQDGEETRVVGGAVRNALLGRPVHEIDLATTAAPALVLARAEAAGIRPVPTGIAHGTVTLLVDGETFEATTLREDVETDGRHARVRFGRDFAADALRRDFTMNALFLSKAGRIFDYAGGLADISAGKLRFIGAPVERIREDYLRILRFFRFSADFSEGPLDAEGLLACVREREGLARLSRERVRAELLKLFATRRMAEVTREMCDAGLLGPLLASAPNPARLARMAAIADEAAEDPLLRLASLCIELPEDADRISDRLRFSNGERQRLSRAAAALIALHGEADPPAHGALRRLLFVHGRAAARDAVLLAAIRAPAPPRWSDALAFVRAAPEPVLPFSGADLLARGLPSGPAVGAALEILKHLWIDAGFPDDPLALAQMLETAAADTR